MKDKPLIVRPIPVPTKYKHPLPAYDQLPVHEFTMVSAMDRGVADLSEYEPLLTKAKLL